MTGRAPATDPWTADPSIAGGSGRVVTVVGASGGLGASTLAVALAVAAARAGARSVAVDAVLHGGGLDVTAGVEHLPGLRWPDLAGTRGAVDGRALRHGVPRAAGAAILSAGRGGAGPPPAERLAATPELLARAVLALREWADVVVVDLPAPHVDVPEGCSTVVLLTGSSARHLADATATREALAPVAARTGLVVRGSQRGGMPDSLAEHLTLPLLAAWDDDRAVVADAERGRVPGERGRSRLARLASRLLGGVTGVDAEVTADVTTDVSADVSARATPPVPSGWPDPVGPGR
jgi:secretion/DNA translocation related CpaE-like protein